MGDVASLDVNMGFPRTTSLKYHIDKSYHKTKIKQKFI